VLPVGLERRLQRRYLTLVSSHLQASQALAAGIHSIPDVAAPFAATLAAYRFLNNERIPLPALVEPLIEVGRAEAATACDGYLLAVHDWSQLMYPQHDSKQDRVALSSKRMPEGYELQTALLVSDRDGKPLAPAVLSLRASDGVHCSRCMRPRQAASPLDELDPAMSYLERQKLPRPLVHVIDAEADSVWHFRQWATRPGRFFLVRADDRLVEYAGQERRCSAIRQGWRQRSSFRQAREVLYRGKKARQWVAEAPVRLLRAAQRNRPKAGDRQRIPGPPLALRLVIAEVRDEAGQTLACWYLLTNVPADVDAATIALWYYWRWSIETYFKLLKSAGMQVEQWEQETAPAIARRLLVASMACVTVWRLARSGHPQAEPTRRLLVRLSGRQMKHRRTFTLPALLAGFWTLLAILDVLEDYSLDEIHQFANVALEILQPNPP
jgi:hypothetical protein